MVAMTNFMEYSHGELAGAVTNGTIGVVSTAEYAELVANTNIGTGTAQPRAGGVAGLDAPSRAEVPSAPACQGTWHDRNHDLYYEHGNRAPRHR